MSELRQDEEENARKLKKGGDCGRARSGASKRVEGRTSLQGFNMRPLDVLQPFGERI